MPLTVINIICVFVCSLSVCLSPPLSVYVCVCVCVLASIFKNNKDRKSHADHINILLMYNTFNYSYQSFDFFLYSFDCTNTLQSAFNTR